MSLTGSMTGRSQAITSSAQRFWIRRESPAAFLWEGLLAVIGLLVLFVYALWPFARYDIEASVAAAARAALDGQGFAWIQIATSGQNIVLSGVQPIPHSGDAALTVARTALCPTWAGHLGCPINVSGQFSNPVIVPPVLVADAGVSQASVCEKSFNDIVAQTQIEFASNSAEISARSGAVLDALAKAAGNCDGMIRIEGHTDSAGAASLNIALSAARADAVAAALTARGLPRDRLQAQGYGAQRPIADNATVEGRAKNRRIEFRVLPNKVESKGDQP